MNKKTFMAAIVVLTLLFLTVPVFRPAKAQTFESVYINPDGSVTGTNSIRREGNVYTLTGNFSGSIQVQKSNIILDGAGYAIMGNGGERGIDLSNGRGQNPTRPEIDNVTVKNLKIINFYYGVNNVNTNNNTFMGNYIEDCLNSFWIIGSSNNTMTSNTLKNADIAINYAGISTITKNNFFQSMLFVWLSKPPVVDGNYWSDYTARYPDAKEIGNTGIGNTPYVFWTQQNGNSTIIYQDNNPLLKPVTITDYSLPEPTTKPTETTNPSFTPSPEPTATPTSPSPTQQPTVKILLPQNDSSFNAPFGGISYQLVYETDSVLSWVGYSIGGKGEGGGGIGSGNRTVARNGTWVNYLGNGGYHTLTLYANDTLGNWATPQTVTYFVNFIPDYTPTPSPSPSLSLTPSPTEQPTLEPSLTPDRPKIGDFAPVIVLGIAIVLAVALGLLVYFRKREEKY